MQKWNAVITVHEHGFRKAIAVFGEFGEVRRTEFFNVLLLHAEDMQGMLEILRERMERSPDSLAFLARIVPVTRTFLFHSAEEFEARAKEIVLEWAPRLAGRSFHVRIRRRGFKGRIASTDEERILNDVVIDSLHESGSHAGIEFEKPDAVIVVETVGTWAGLSFWTQEDIARYPFVRVS
jgi:tRNA(Ser,Leu) C12 N-acetylase TAN1